MRRFSCLLVLLSLLTVPRVSEATQVQVVSLQARDLIFNPADGHLYASVSGSVPGIGNTVTAIDPVTGTLGASVFVGSQPGKLALADDGTTLYVALDGANAVRVVDLATHTAGMQFSLGADPFFGPYGAEDIAVQPGNTSVVAIALTRYASPRHAGVAIFENGVARANKTQDHTGSNRIEFSSDPSRVYGFNNETTEFGFRRLLVDADGVTELDVATNLITGFSSEIYYDHGRVYGSGGEVIDPEAYQLLGTFPMPDYTYRHTAAPDGDRAYFLTGDFFSGGIILREFDTNTFTLVMMQPISRVTGTPRSLVRWGSDGLAFRTDTQIFLLTRIHEPPTTDMRITQADSSDPVDRGTYFQYRLVASNDGASPSSDVVVRDVLPPEVSLNYAYPSQGSCSDSSGTLVCNLGSISEGDSVVIQLNVLANTVGTAENLASVSTSTLETNTANNSSSELTVIQEPQVADLGIQVMPSTGTASAGGALTYTIGVGNAGPSPATDVGLTQAFAGVPITILSATPMVGTCSTDTGHVSCMLGTLEPGESTQVVVVVIPGDAGYLYSYANVSSPVPDPVYYNNFAETYVTVLQSASNLLDDLMDLVRSYNLKKGLDRNLLDDCEMAKSEITGGDSTGACTAIGEFRKRVGRQSGRQLTLSQAFQLDSDANEIAGILHCSGASLASRLETLPSVREFSFRANARLGDGDVRARLDLPHASRVRVDVFDVRGRLVRTLLDRQLPEGAHGLRWDGTRGDGARAPVGIYFLRARSDHAQAVARVTLLR